MNTIGDTGLSVDQLTTVCRSTGLTSAAIFRMAPLMRALLIELSPRAYVHQVTRARETGVDPVEWLQKVTTQLGVAAA